MPDLIYSRKSNNEFLNYGTIAKLAPAAFSVNPIEGVSDRYGHYTTTDAIEKLKLEGWRPVQAAQTQSRKQSDREHTKHLIAFAREQDIDKKEGRPEIVLYNSSDRSSALKLYSGYFRWICSNSLISGSGFESKLIHSKTQIKGFDTLLENTFDNLDRAANNIERMKDHIINYDQAHRLGCMAASLRWKPLWRAQENRPADQEISAGTYWTEKTVDSFFRAKRYDEHNLYSDKQYSLWDVFNRVQEGLMRSGADVHSFTKKSPAGSERKARAISSVSKAIQINRDCWDLFEEVAA